MKQVLLAIAVLVCVDQTQAQTPPARYWHSITSNNATTPQTSRVYVFAGNSGTQNNTAYLNDLWYYRGDTGSWTAVTPSGKTKPRTRGDNAWSCGGGKCVSAGGTSGTSYLNDTVYYTESTNAWTQVACRKPTACPSARWLAAMAYDPTRGYHVYFGGANDNVTYNDTWTFSGSSWTKRAPAIAPAVRSQASAAFVPSHVNNGTAISMNKVVIFGGDPYPNSPYPDALCDLHAWNGTNWEAITAINQGPCLVDASMAWDTSSAASPRLIVAGGWIMASGNTNSASWYFSFSGPRSGTWVQASPSCSPRAWAKAGYDASSKKLVFFGGSDGSGLAYNDTLVCP